MILAIGLSAFFHHSLDSVRGRPYRSGLDRGLAWRHFVLLNVGAIGVTGLLMIAGVLGGSHLLTSTTPPPRSARRGAHPH